MEPKILGLIQNGALIVTAQNRLAREIQRGYDAGMKLKGERCWPSAKVISLSGWTRTLWEHLWRGVVVDGFTSQALWEEIVEADAKALDVKYLDTATTAEVAREAYRLMGLYNSDPRKEYFPDDECKAFIRWFTAYEKKLDAKGWLDEGALPLRLARVVEEGGEGGIELPGTIGLAGFDEITPVYRDLFAAFERAGVEVVKLPFPRCDANLTRFCAVDPEAEVLGAARWAAAKLEGNPEARIGVVASDLNRYAPLIERVFTKLLDPSSTMPGASYKPPPFDISLGGGLGEEPVVAAAMELIASVDSTFDSPRLRELIANPFWGPGEVVGSSILSSWLAARGRTEFTFADLVADLKLAVTKGVFLAESLVERFGEMKESAQGAGGGNDSRAPSVWARSFLQLLDAGGWPGTATLNSREYQAVTSFREVVGGLGVLDNVRGSASRKWVVKKLKRAITQPFRPKSEEVPIVALGMLEAAGAEFDYLWFLGCDDEHLPAAARPNPFLSFELQRAAEMRQSTPEGQLVHSREVFSRVIASAPEVVVSYPQRVSQTDVLPSRFIEDIPEGDPVMGEDYTPAAQYSHRFATSLDTMDDVTLALQPGEKLKGGTNLFADQARCPFSAFAHYRLSATTAGDSEEGLSPLEKGNGVHEALHALMSTFPTRKKLVAATDRELEAAIAKAVSEGMKAVKKERGYALGPKLLGVERKRLTALLRDWVELDKSRPDFEVLEVEAVRKLVVGGLELNVRIDRIDREEGGKVHILDYKTGGAVSTSKLLKERGRPTLPQLPIYALACEESTGVGFAKVLSGETGIEGIFSSEEPGKKELTPEEWERLRSEWRQALDNLAREYEEGEAGTLPSLGSCQYCDLPWLCRSVFGGEEES